jgi:uncharacterized membrane protein
MLIHLRNFVITFVVFFAIDLIWLGLIAKNLYAKHLGYIMAEKVNWTAAILFYVLFIIGILYFAITPATSLGNVVLSGALFGLISYATYDLTNLATIKSWPVIITVIDLVWGTTLSTLTASISYLIIDKLR